MSLLGVRHSPDCISTDDATANLGGGENNRADDVITNTPRIDLNYTDLFLVE